MGEELHELIVPEDDEPLSPQSAEKPVNQAEKSSFSKPLRFSGEKSWRLGSDSRSRFVSYLFR